MTKQHPFIKWLREHYACAPAVQWAMTKRSPQEAWAKCEDEGWMRWLLEATVPINKQPPHGTFDDCWCLKPTGIRKRYTRIPWKAPRAKIKERSNG